MTTAKEKEKVRLSNTKHQAKTRTRKAFAVAPHKTETSTPREEKTFKVVGKKQIKNSIDLFLMCRTPIVVKLLFKGENPFSLFPK